MIYRSTPMKLRGNDSFGSGAFGASRGTRTHNGVDLVCAEGDWIMSPVAGTVTKIGYPYDPTGPKGHFRYVEVTAEDGCRHRVFYVSPTVDQGNRISQGHPIGVAQGLQSVYPGITDHIHYEIKLPDGSFVDPTDQVT